MATNIDRMPGTAPLAIDQTASTSVVAATSDTALNRRVFADARGERQRDGENGAGANEEGRFHAEHTAQHEEHDRSHAHLERDRAGGERPVSRRHEIRDERLERGSHGVDPRVEDDDSADHARDAETGAHREHRHPDRGEAEPEQHERQPAPSAVARPIRHEAGPRHQQEQQHVVDRHHHADDRAMAAKLVPHEDRDERTQQRPGDAIKQTTETDEQAFVKVQQGLAATYGIISVVILLIFSMLYLRELNRAEVFEA